MKGASSKERLSQMHEALDRELEQATTAPRSSSASRRDRDELRYTSQGGGVAGRPGVVEHGAREGEIRQKKSEISELERKLMELERKMDNISLSSDDEQPPKHAPPREPPSQDTARFTQDPRERNSNKFVYSYPSLGDEEDEEEDEDSEDFAEVQRAVERKKQEAREQAARRTVNTRALPNPAKAAPEVKIATEVESVLKPKYSNEKPRSRPSQEKKSVRDSVTSKKSQEKQQERAGQLSRAHSKRSVKSAHSNANSLRRSREGSRDRSFERSQKEECLRAEEAGLAREVRRVGNLEREVTHYKRLAEKYRAQVEEYRVMEVELRELRKSFAKSELIRAQQKKLIDSLRSKVHK